MAETSASVAQNESASADERYDAQVAVHNEGLAGLIPAPAVQAAIDQIQASFAEQEFAKSLRKPNLIPGPHPANRGKPGFQSVQLDDMQIIAQGDFWERPGALSFDVMKTMVEQTPLLNSIIMTRIRQVNRFCRPATDKTGAGFSIQHVDPTVELNDAQQESVKLLTSFINNCGWETDPRRRKRLKRDTFSQFMAKSVRDSLILDAAPIETEFKKDRLQGLDGFYAVDGATVRLCTEQGYQGDDEIYAVQVIQGRLRTAYTYDDLVYEVRNPRTDVTACGYGYSETEMLVRVVTYFLNTLTYNGSFFDKNAIPRGVMNIFGNYDQSDLAAFKRYWNSMVRGAQNVHNMPILVSKDRESGANFTEIGGQLDEMAFAKWISFLTSIACSIYGIAPEEISMESFASQKSALSGSDTEEKLVSSNDKGLRPLLGFYENVISDYIIQPFSPDYTFRFVGLDAEDSKQRFERQKLSLTWNEMRGQDGMDPIPGKMGDAPMNASLLSVWAQENDVGQPPQEEEDFGDPNGTAAPPPGSEGAEEGMVPGEPGEGDDAGGDDEMDFGEDEEPAGEDEEQPPMAKALPAAAFGMPVFRIEV